jgi:hypothetical protein
MKNFVMTYDDTLSIIPLITYDGNGETLHPSVLNLGFKWNGYQYWMGNTPMPKHDTNFENPSIWVSNNGIDWIVPEGVNNPVVPKPVYGSNADSELFFENNILYIIYKETTHINCKCYRFLKLVKSNDGRTWTKTKTIVIPVKNEIENVSPSLIKIGSTYYIYYFTADSYTKEHIPVNPRICRVSCNIVDEMYSNVEKINIPVDPGFIWWHLHIFRYNDSYYLSALRSKTHDPGDQICIFKSEDGLNFIKNDIPVLNGKSGNIKVDAYYRPCISIINDQPTLYCGFLSSNKFGLLKVNINLS